MKEYKYKINGNVYNVVIGDIEDNIAHVEVNGTHYNVEMEKKQKAVKETNDDGGFSIRVGNGRKGCYADNRNGWYNIDS